jgi:hypothetical protein
MRVLPALILETVAANPAAVQAQAVPSQLADPALPDKLGNVMQALTGALLNLPVGEVQAALEGRPATAADRRTTVRDLGRRSDLNFDRNLQQQIAGGRETMRAGMKAMAAAVPAIMKGVNEARGEIERAVGNMPSPVYPQR